MRRHLLCNSLVVTLFFVMVVVRGSWAAEPDDKLREAAAKAANPGEMHKKLEPLVGKWEMTVKMWLAPDKPPIDGGTATAETRWVMGGRFIRTQYAFDFRGIKTEAVRVTGYDTVRETYVGTWIDNASTRIKISTGKVDGSGKVFTFESEDMNVLTKGVNKSRMVLTIHDKDSYEETGYITYGGHETKTMEINAKRAK